MRLRNLMLSAMLSLTALLAFSACQEKEEPLGIIDITTDIASAEVPVEGGKVVVNVTSNTDWIVEAYMNQAFPEETPEWCMERLQVSATSGKGNALTPVTITVPKNDDKVNVEQSGGKVYEREFVVKFRPAAAESPYAPVKIFQAGENSRSTRISIAEARRMYRESGEEKLTVTESVKIGGIVISSHNPQTVSEGNIMIQDGTDPNSGIIIYSKSAWGSSNFGDSVEVELKGGVMEVYYGLTQYKPTGDAQFKVLKQGADPDPDYAEITGEQFLSGAYESQYVKLVAQVIDADLTKKMSESPKVETEDKATFLMFSRTNAPWADEAVPQGAGALIGLCGSYSNAWQLVPSVASGFAGMTGERFSGAPSVTTGEATEVTGTSAVLHGSYKYAGEETVTEVGFAWKAEDGEFAYAPAESVAEEFSVELDGLTEGTAYVYYAYAKLGDQEFKGAEKTFLASEDEVVVTVASLVADLKAGKVESGASLASYGALEGIIAAVNGEGENYYSKAALVDGDGAKNTGIILYHKNFNDAKVGDKIRLDLSNAAYDYYNGLREIKWDSGEPSYEVISSGNDFVVPELSVAEVLADDYQGMRVTLKNVRSAEEAGTTWYSGTSSASNVRFTDGTDEIPVRTSKFAAWKDEVIATGVTADLSCVPEIFKEEVQVYPIYAEDVAPFSGAAPAEPKVTTADATDVTETGMVLHGSYAYDAAVAEAGFEYREADAAESREVAAEVSGENFQAELQGLTSGATYVFKAFVGVDGKRYYGEEKTAVLAGGSEKTVTVAEVVRAIADGTLQKGSSLAGFATYMEAYVAAADGDGNNYRGKLSVVDGTGEPMTGIILYGLYDSPLKTGDKIRVALSNAEVDVYNNLREIKFNGDAVIDVLSGGNDVTVPTLTAAQLNGGEYQGMYVRLANVTAPAEGGSWNGNVTFTESTGSFVVRSGNDAAWTGGEIRPGSTGTVGGVAEVFKETQQLLPVSMEDVKDFWQEPSAPEFPLIEGAAGDGIYTSNVTLPEQSAVDTDAKYAPSKFAVDGGEYDGVKLGTSKEAGSYSFRLEKSGDVTLTFYAVSWKDKRTNARVEILNGGTVEGSDKVELALKSHDGMTGNPTYQIGTFGENDFYTLQIKGATAETIIRFTMEEMDDTRMGFVGVNVK